jgi:hypothetical protein
MAPLAQSAQDLALHGDVAGRFYPDCWRKPLMQSWQSVKGDGRESVVLGMERHVPGEEANHGVGRRGA